MLELGSVPPPLLLLSLPWLQQHRCTRSQSAWNSYGCPRGCGRAGEVGMCKEFPLKKNHKKKPHLANKLESQLVTAGGGNCCCSFWGKVGFTLQKEPVELLLAACQLEAGFLRDAKLLQGVLQGEHREVMVRHGQGELGQPFSAAWYTAGLSADSRAQPHAVQPTASRRMAAARPEIQANPSSQPQELTFPVIFWISFR